MPYQIEVVNDLAQYDRVGHYDEPGAGKTAMATFFALYGMITYGTRPWIVTMPPILLRQWQRWLSSIHRKNNDFSPLTSVIYHGDQKVRRKLDLDVDFILTTYGMIKADFALFQEKLEGLPFGGLNDEATAIKNIESDTYLAIKDLFEEKQLALLTGTPLTTPMDGYAYIRLITGNSIYRNVRNFGQMHVAERDAYKNVIGWKNLDVLASNMKVQTSRILRREVSDQLPPVIFTPIVYDLAPEHYALYQQVAEEKLVELEGEGVIDASTSGALRNILAQLIINWGYYADKETCQPAALELIEEVLEEIGPQGKLLVAAYYQRSNQYLYEKLQHHGAEVIYGARTEKQRQAALERFKTDPSCRVLVIQPTSGGIGVDGLQHVCSDMIFVESCSVPAFLQAVARLDRTGQVNPVNCRVAIANRTTQVRAFKSLLANDEQINAVQGGYQDLKDAIYGG